MSQTSNVRTRVRGRPLDTQRQAAQGRAALLALLLGLPSGCFSVERVDVGKDGTELTWHSVHQVDDFDDGDWYPDWDLFEPWMSDSWGAGGAPPTHSGSVPGTSASGESGYARFLDFELTEQNDGALLATYALSPFLVDLTDFDELVFDAKATARDGEALPEQTPPRIWARLDCPGAADEGYAPHGEPALIGLRFTPTPTWQTFTLALAEFQQPEWQEWVGAEVDPQRCLGLVDMLGFEVDLLRAPDELAGVLAIDDVRLRKQPIESGRFSEHERLSEWECFAFGEGTEASREPSCSVVSELEGTDVASARFETPHDAEAEFSGIALCAAFTGGAMDLSDFKQIAFEAKLAAMTGRIPSDVRVWLELGCRELPATDPLIRAEFSPSTDFGSFELPLSEFREPVVPTEGFREECLARVDQVCAVVDRSKSEHTSAELALDHVVLR